MKDQSMAEPQSPILPKGALSALSLCYFTMAVASLSVIGLLVPMAEGLAVTTSEIAYLVTAFSLTYAVSAIGLQMLVGDRDRRYLMVAGLLTMAVGVSMTGLAQAYSVAFAGRMVMALGAGVVGPIASAAGAALVAPDQRGAALGFVFSGMTVATVLGVPLVTYGGNTIGWRASLVLIGVLGIVTAALVLLLVPKHANGQRASGQAVWAVIKDPVLSPAISITAWQMAAQFVTYSVVAPHLSEGFGVRLSYLPLILMGFGVGGILGNLIAMRLIDRVGPAVLMKASLLITGAVFVVLHFAPASPWIAYVCYMIWAIAALMLFAPQQARLIALAPDEANLLMALNATAIYLGMAGGAALAGVLYAASGVAHLALTSAVLMVCAYGAFWVSVRMEQR